MTYNGRLAGSVRLGHLYVVGHAVHPLLDLSFAGIISAERFGVVLDAAAGAFARLVHGVVVAFVNVSTSHGYSLARLNRIGQRNNNAITAQPNRQPNMQPKETKSGRNGGAARECEGRDKWVIAW